MADLTVPNFTGAAEQQAAGNLSGAQTATTANRIDQYNPYGSLTYQQGPGGTWSQTMSLTPEQQQLLSQYQGLGTAFGQAGQGALDAYAQIDPTGGFQPNVQGMQQVGDALYGAATSRLDPQWQQRQSMQDTQLYNQGLRPGGEAYTNAKRDMNFAQNDAYQQARAQALAGATQSQRDLFGMGQQASNTAANQALAFRGQTLPTQPNFQNYYQQQATTGPNYLGALGEQYQGQLDMYNADVSRQNAMLQGLYGLGTGILGLPTGEGATLGGQLLGPLATQAGSWLSGLMGSGTSSLDPAMLDSYSQMAELGWPY